MTHSKKLSSICATFVASTWVSLHGNAEDWAQVEARKETLHHPKIFGGLVRLSKTKKKKKKEIKF